MLYPGGLIVVMTTLSMQGLLKMATHKAGMMISLQQMETPLQKCTVEENSL